MRRVCVLSHRGGGGILAFCWKGHVAQGDASKMDGVHMDVLIVACLFVLLINFGLDQHIIEHKAIKALAVLFYGIKVLHGALTNKLSARLEQDL